MADPDLTTHVFNEPRQSGRPDLIRVDFRDRSVEECLSQLLELARAGKINGLVFAARMTNEPAYIFDGVGRLSDNQAEAIGAAVLLQHSLAAA